MSSVFDEETLQRLEGGDDRVAPQAAIGHTRYSTTGSNTLPNVQPVYAETDRGELMLGHNGNLTNARWLRDELTEQGVEFATASDTEVLAKLIAHAPGRTWAQRVDHAFHRATGAYTFTMLTADALVAARDPVGFRPLALGRLPGGGWAVASESAALDAMGAQFVRDVEAGEVLTITAEGVDSYRSAGATPERERLCVFEYVYLARPDSVIDGRLLYEARLEMGRALAREHPADADLVIAVPDSAIPAAIGYAEEAGLPYREGLIKSRYVGRTFIQPAQAGREEAVRLKFNPLPELLPGKRVVVVDDSIVRGTTTGPIVAMLRRAGAAEVHVRIHSPGDAAPVLHGRRHRTARRADRRDAHDRRDPPRHRRRLARLPVAGRDARRGRRAARGPLHRLLRRRVPDRRAAGARQAGAGAPLTDGPHLPRSRRRSWRRPSAPWSASPRRRRRRPRPRCSAASAASARCSASTRRRIPTRSSSAAPMASARS